MKISQKKPPIFLINMVVLILLSFGKILEHIYDDVGDSSYYRTDRNSQNPSP